MSESDPRPEGSSVARKTLQMIFLFLILVVAPAASWFYLRSGLAYRKDHLATLQEGIPLPEARFHLIDGTPVPDDALSDRIRVILFTPDGETGQRQIEELESVHSQFDDRTDVLFLQILPDSTIVLRDIPADTLQWKVLADSTGYHEWEAVCRETWPEAPGQAVFLMDRHDRLRQVYDASSRTSLAALVEVVAVLLPPKKLSKPELNRTTEK